MFNLFAFDLCFRKSIEYDEYKEHQEDIERPVLSMNEWLQKREELDSLYCQLEHGKITAAELDCHDTWELEFLLGA